MHFLALAALAGLTTTAAALPAPAADAAAAAATPGYVQGYPICNVSGFTQSSGKYNQTTHQQPGATLLSCLNDCREDVDCKSISYAEKYTGCYFYNKATKDVELEQDETSYFAYYDEVCPPYFAAE